MRLKKEAADISYSETQRFFKNRAEKFNKDNPYSTTMYQDQHPELVEARNRKEKERLLPLLELDRNSKVLDVACGIGRWADVMPRGGIAKYCGVDFSEELLEIARKRDPDPSFTFLKGSASDLKRAVEGEGTFNRFLFIGILMYLNDRDLENTLNQVPEIADEHALICVREPVGLESRLTLKDFYSDELKDMYNAIYRTRDEYAEFFEKTLLKHGFRISEEGFMFESALNDRKETAQYYFILKR